MHTSHTPSWIRVAAVAAPSFMLGYALLRVLDGLDGERGPGGLAWDVGHTLFLVSFLLFGVLLVGLRRLAIGTRSRALVESLLGTGMLGVAAFVWVIVGDLFPAFADLVATGAAVQITGPVLFLIGSAGLLALQAAPKVRRVPVWSPALIVVGFAVISVDLDLLPLGACLFLAALAPLAYRRKVETPGVKPGLA